MRARIRALSFLPVLGLSSCGGDVRTGPALSKVSIPIDESHLAILLGNVPFAVRTGVDEGAISPDAPLDRMLLVLKSSPEQQEALDDLVAAQQDPRSPLYHRWLRPQEFGARFGASDAELAQLTAWLATHGFSVDNVAAGRRLMIFSGTAGEVRDAFHTGLHRYCVDGLEHVANAEDPQIPVALGEVVEGVVSLHDFRRQSEMRTRRLLDAEPEYSAGSTHYLYPADFAAIYDLNPLYSAGMAGAGSEIAIAGRSNINLSDVDTFRSIAGLEANTPTVILDGADPGLVANDQQESTLDVEWSGAVAPAAAVTLVSAASTATTDGVDLAAQHIVNHATAPVMSVSYGSCEQETGRGGAGFLQRALGAGGE